MSLPLIVITGQAGSGKDTVAAMIAERTGGVVIAQADPMKRFVAQTFGFTNESLWGPSEQRNKVHIDFGYDAVAHNACCSVHEYGYDFVCEVLPELDHTQKTQATEALETWVGNVTHHGLFAVEKGLSARYVLQTLGTQWGRRFSRDIWSRYAIRTAIEALGGQRVYSRETGLSEDSTVNYNFAVISDGRFRNEIVNVRAVGGAAWKIVSDSEEQSPVGIPGHASEAEQKGIPDSFFHEMLINRKEDGLVSLRKAVEYALEPYTEAAATTSTAWFR
jgi:hypothetical protein